MNKNKIIIIGSIVISIMLLNFFNSSISSFLLNEKRNSNLQLRKNHTSICQALFNFDIKNVDAIFIGDSHLYSSLNLEEVNKNFQNLILACAIPTISFNNLSNIADQIFNKYKPKLTVISLSAFQFMLADQSKEKERKYHYNNYTNNNKYSFKFDIIKQFALSFLNHSSEIEIATSQIEYLKKLQKSMPTDFERKKIDKINNIIIKRYNNYEMNEKKNYLDIKKVCRKFERIKDKLIFIDIPTPNFFKNNLSNQDIYQKNINELSKCFTVIKSSEINDLSDDLYYFDRGAYFLKKEDLVFDVSHMNFAGALIYSKYLIKILKNYNLK
tara:strand:- start:188 stop:1168 length:981 start_codon:yes stop_codon:yes gene_type:complete